MEKSGDRLLYNIEKSVVWSKSSEHIRSLGNWALHDTFKQEPALSATISGVVIVPASPHLP